MVEQTINKTPLFSESELSSLAKVAGRLFTGKQFTSSGHNPTRIRPGFGIEFLDYREYTHNDDQRYIDWRASVRSRQPQIRRYRDETSSDWFVCFDQSLSMTIDNGKKWNLAIQLAAAMSYLLLQLGHRVGALTFSNKLDQFFPLGRGHTQFSRIARLLTSCQAKTLYSDDQKPKNGSEGLISCAKMLPRKTSLVIISDFLSEDSMQSGLRYLTRLQSDIHALQILSVDELYVPADGVVSIYDIEQSSNSTSLLTVNATTETKTAVARDLTLLQDRLSEYCRRQKIFLTHCDTSQSWKSILLNHLKRFY